MFKPSQSLTFVICSRMQSTKLISISIPPLHPSFHYKALTLIFQSTVALFVWVSSSAASWWRADRVTDLPSAGEPSGTWNAGVAGRNQTRWVIFCLNRQSMRFSPPPCSSALQRGGDAVGLTAGSRIPEYRDHCGSNSTLASFSLHGHS